MNNEYNYEWHLGGFSSNNEKLLNECATLFSSHYGKWSSELPDCTAHQIIEKLSRLLKPLIFFIMIVFSQIQSGFYAPQTFNNTTNIGSTV
jgi:hypothetical protein